ncbi:hypothetical protein GALMADRAFT_240006 [Galerina marginata CBS 339.88]|uniref:Protein N-terminal glutamine amidohydrolase n=1 Tax=Galerina marginata (strain CBS 339.88) TaxID=685588 RepID=A0A067THG9_GALM3|nr:hypothetical protein GALMADRAFT_240006 [Galerina marginata CBS 339.88]
MAPLVPSNSVYTSCYCEENIYLLCQEYLRSNAWENFVVFISNAHKTVALWSQKAARLEDNPVIWDYHVILVLRPRHKDTTEVNEPHTSWVYDFDTRLSMPCEWERYLCMTVPEGISPPIYESQFRVIPGELFVQHFASDRTHMLVKKLDQETDTEQRPSRRDAQYSSPPPIYAPICGPLALQEGITNNLMLNYVSMNGNYKDIYGFVVDRAGVDDIFRV